MTGMQIVGRNRYQFDHDGNKYIVTYKSIGDGYYCRWEIRQAEWIKGLPVWKSRLHLAEDRDEGLRQVMSLFLETTARMQEPLF